MPSGSSAIAVVHPVGRIGLITAFEALHLAFTQLQQTGGFAYAQPPVYCFFDHSQTLHFLLAQVPHPAMGDILSLQLGGDIILEHLQPPKTALTTVPLAPSLLATLLGFCGFSYRLAHQSPSEVNCLIPRDTLRGSSTCLSCEELDGARVRRSDRGAVLYCLRAMSGKRSCIA